MTRTCKDTVEERIHKLQQEKDKLADADIFNKLNPAMVGDLLNP